MKNIQRRGVIAGLIAAYLPALVGQKSPDGSKKPITDFKVKMIGIKVEVKTEIIGVSLTYEGPPNSSMLVVQADGREVKLTAKEVMDALEGK